MKYNILSISHPITNDPSCGCNTKSLKADTSVLFKNVSEKELEIFKDEMEEANNIYESGKFDLLAKPSKFRSVSYNEMKSYHTQKALHHLHIIHIF